MNTLTQSLRLVTLAHWLSALVGWGFGNKRPALGGRLGPQKLRGRQLWKLEVGPRCRGVPSSRGCKREVVPGPSQLRAVVAMLGVPRPVDTSPQLCSVSHGVLPCAGLSTCPLFPSKDTVVSA